MSSLGYRQRPKGQGGEPEAPPPVPEGPEPEGPPGSPDPRRRSVLDFARRHAWDEAHCRQVTALGPRHADHGSRVVLGAGRNRSENRAYQSLVAVPMAPLWAASFM